MRGGWWGVIALVTLGCGAPAKVSPPAPQRPVDTHGSVFGPKIIDLALAFDDAAKKALLNSPDADASATLTFTDERGERRSGSVTIHLKGSLGSSRPLDDKPGFRIDLGVLGDAFHLDSLTLNNMVQDPSMLHETLAYPVYEAAGVKVPRTGYAHLTVNGEDYGLYLNLETPDARFLTRRFGDAHGVLYEGAHGVDLRAPDLARFELHEGDDPDRARLKGFIDAVDRRGDGVFYGAAAAVDTTSFVHMMAASALLADWDNYFSSNNYRIYWVPTTRRWVFIPTGLDQTFMRWTSVFAPAGLLFQKCLASERCVKDYASALREVASRFTALDLTAHLDATLAEIDATATADPKKPYSAEKTQHERDALRAFITRRPGEVTSSLGCLSGGREVTPGACGVVIASNVATGQCLDMGVQTLPQRLQISACTGAIGQRWAQTPKDGGFELAPIRGGPIFGLRVSNGAARIVDRDSGQCVAAAPPAPLKAARVPAPTPESGLTEAACSLAPAQLWHLRWSIYQP